MCCPVPGHGEIRHVAAVQAARRPHPELSVVVIHVDEGIDEHRAMTPSAGHAM